MSEPTLPIYIPDHAQQIISTYLYNKIRALPRWRAFAMGMGQGSQQMEDDLFAILNGTLFETSGGVMLDKWGGFVGEQRGGLTDDEYRRFIQARILTSVCGGTGDEYIVIWELLTAPSQSVRAVAVYPASFIMQVTRDDPMRDEVARRVARMMEDAKADGIGMGLTESVLFHFGFEGDPFAQGFNQGLLARSLR